MYIWMAQQYNLYISKRFTRTTINSLQDSVVNGKAYNSSSTERLVPMRASVLYETEFLI